jgi:hypothetical protein
VKGPTGDATGENDQNVNVGQLTFRLLQAFSRLGDIASELGKYDLVRRDRETLTLNAANPLSSITLTSEQARSHDLALLVENNGGDESGLRLDAELAGATEQVPSVADMPRVVHASERRRVTVSLSNLASGSHRLTLRLSKAGLVRATKTILLQVLPPPQQPPSSVLEPSET